MSTLYICPLFDLLLSFHSPAVQPVDNQSQGLKMNLGLIYKQPRVNSIRSGTPSHLHLYHTSRLYTSPGLISCHSSEITLLPAVLLPVGEKAEGSAWESFIQIFLCISSDSLIVLHNFYLIRISISNHTLMGLQQARSSQHGTKTIGNNGQTIWRLHTKKICLSNIASHSFYKCSYYCVGSNWTCFYGQSIPEHNLSLPSLW